MFDNIDFFINAVNHSRSGSLYYSLSGHNYRMRPVRTGLADTRHWADQGRGSVRDVGQGRGLAPPPELPDQAPAGDAVLVRNRPGHIHLEPSEVRVGYLMHTL